LMIIYLFECILFLFCLLLVKQYIT